MFMFNCQYCNKECKSPNSLRNHERLCTINPARQVSNFVAYNANNDPWNKGKTGVQVSPMKGKPGSFLGRKHSSETKQKISEKLSINNKGGRAKWYDVAGQRVQGTWERDIALKLEELKIKWVKLKTNRDTLTYVMQGKLRSYTPDFYLEDYGVYLEVKGFWWGNDKEKMRIVLETYPDKNIVIIEKEQYDKIMQGELVW